MRGRDEIEAILGEPVNYVPDADDKPHLIEWAIAIGIEPAAAHIMPFVDLVNLYHSGGDQNSPAPTMPSEPPDVLRATSQAVIDTLASMEDKLREIVRDELAAGPARRIEIVTPTANVTIDGPVHERTELVVRVASLGHAIMLVGPAGCGKTMIGAVTAKALSLPFLITSTVNDTHELMGFVDGNGRYHRTPFRQAFECGGVWLGDEIDAWDAGALLAVNSALANGFATFPDQAEPIHRHHDFRAIATANTYGQGADRVYVGRNELDAASLDRFAVIGVGYDDNLERLFSNGNRAWLNRVRNVREQCEDKRIRHVVSSRAIIFGVAGLAAGIDWADCEELYLFKGMTEKDRKKIT